MSAATLDPTRLISGFRALEIAEKDALDAYGDLSPFRIQIRQESDQWFIDYELKVRMNGGGPHYVINALTGEITSKRYEQ
jgi:hypothetical protein